MIPISQTASYALLALSCLDGPGGEPKLVQDVANCTGIPRPYLSKLINRLAQKDLVRARRGHKGGVVLQVPAAELPLWAIIEAVDGSEWRTRCMLGFASCSEERTCPSHDFWKVERERVHTFLNKIKLSEISTFEHEGHCFRLANVLPSTLPQGGCASKRA